MARERPDPDAAGGTVLSFRRRHPAQAPPSHGVWPGAPPTSSPVDHLAKFEWTGERDDYRHRMRMNVLSVVVLMLLVIAGIWIADTIAEMQKQQDCALQGRRNCMPIDVPASSRP
jgi:hypothetical protein